MFKIEKIMDNVDSIMDLGGVRSFLIQGTEKTVLVDTCCGLGNLKEIVDKMTQFPIEVICTHGHVDHASGSYGFNKVYLNEADWELVRQSTTIERRFRFVNNGAVIPKCSLEQFIPQREGGYLNLVDGQLFDLGGLTLECVAIPGHTQGMMGILLKELRVIILGDACNPFTFMQLDESTDLKTYMNSLSRLKKRDSEFDEVWLSHGEVKCPKTVIDTVYETCNLILEKKDDAVPFSYRGESSYVAAARDENGIRLDGKVGNVVYRPDKI